MSPYCLQYRIRKCISSCEGRQHLNMVNCFLEKDIKNCLTDALILVLRLRFFYKI